MALDPIGHGSWYMRAPDDDISSVGNPKTVYVDSTTLTEGMLVYDSTGTSIGKVVTNIKDGKFDIITPYTLTFSIYGSLVPAPSVTISYGNNTIPVSNGDTISVFGQCKIDATSNGYYTHIKIDDTRVDYGNPPRSYTFTPSKNCTVTVYTDNR